MDRVIFVPNTEKEQGVTKHKFFFGHICNNTVPAYDYSFYDSGYFFTKKEKKERRCAAIFIAAQPGIL